ncbi:RagB/SusD family nutrient uptake outer membrane protein [Flavobacterium sp. GT3P67]|uniref:RagB/SusD family nutrient uptake outer membrane protein n=1 Tax=Flavobacterium sp. GT3P67 TaxID=2541722 RepID=UPI0010466B3E|nr:RagB/SusD family nutrient uptake outer membrane protein [Flavobacterium sp. GT3P67]TDE53240.1 RagB/SusD family nutrient uptake outer membrane protein [Flavobacterium sp. GT3P67]
MKKIILGFALLALSITFNACDKLDLAPEDYFNTEAFWKTPSQVDGAMVGLHQQLRNYQFTLFTLGELRGGTLRDGTSFTGTASLNSGSIVRQDLRESSPGISGWAGFYAAIFQVNNFIYQVEKADYLVATDKSYYLGQAYGLRAFYYFQLYRTYGRVPLAKEPKIAINLPNSSQDAYLPRTATEKETLDFIKEDVNKSVANFTGNYTTKMQKAQWSLAASQMLLGEVYLWSAKVKIDGAAPTSTTADLAIARAAMEAVIPKYSLQPSFANVFNSADIPAIKGNNEIIFAMRYGFGEASNSYSQFIYAITDPLSGYVDDKGVAIPASDPLKVNGGGTIIRYEYKYELYAKYDAADTRANVTFLNFNKGAVKATNLRKFIGTIVSGARAFTDDFPIYRLSEAILMLAEIKNKQGQDPSVEINRIRTRAYAGGGGVAPVYVNGSFEQNELAIFVERQKEFVGEGKIWYDLRRMQDASGNPLAFSGLPLVGVLQNIAGQNHKLLWPIDLFTLTTDQTLGLDAQNPGYKGT